MCPGSNVHQIHFIQLLRHLTAVMDVHIMCINNTRHYHSLRLPLSGSKVASCNFEMPVRCEDIPRGSSGIDFDMDQDTPDGAKVSVKGNLTTLW